MSFKKHLEKNSKDTSLIYDYKVRSAKIIFLFSALFFFLNIFLLGSDKTNSYDILELLLPINYVLFVASLMFLGLTASKHLLAPKSETLAKGVSVLIIIIFCIPLLVFFIERESIISLL